MEPSERASNDSQMACAGAALCEQGNAGTVSGYSAAHHFGMHRESRIEDPFLKKFHQKIVSLAALVLAVTHEVSRE
jgi:hypothetical protein